MNVRALFTEGRKWVTFAILSQQRRRVYCAVRTKGINIIQVRGERAMKGIPKNRFSLNYVKKKQLDMRRFVIKFVRLLYSELTKRSCTLRNATDPLWQTPESQFRLSLLWFRAVTFSMRSTPWANVACACACPWPCVCACGSSERWLGEKTHRRFLKKLTVAQLVGKWATKFRLFKTNNAYKQRTGLLETVQKYFTLKRS